LATLSPSAAGFNFNRFIGRAFSKPDRYRGRRL
jgi:hypothetical protein